MVIYTVYKTTNLINNKTYIGVHKTMDPNDSYLGSGEAIKAAIKKYGRHNFSKEVLFSFDNSADMLAKEAELVEINENTYNLIKGGGSYSETSYKITESHRKNLSKSLTGRKLSEETKAKMRASAGHRRGKKNSIEHNLKISKTLKEKAKHSNF